MHAEYGGRNFSGKGGKVQFTGKEKGKGMKETPCPSGGGGKKGQSFYLGLGKDRGIPSKSGGKGKGSRWAATHD